MRDDSENKFRISLSATCYRWIAPYEYDTQIIRTEPEKQVVRYAVKGEEVHIYKNGEYLNTFDIKTIGDMNAAGTNEEFLSSAKPANINDGENLISNPDFAATAHNAAPAGRVSDLALGKPPTPRIQEKSKYHKLQAYHE